MKHSGQPAKPYTPAFRRRLRRAIFDFHVRAFGEEMARVNRLPLAARRQYIGEIIDKAPRKGAKSGKPALGVTP